MEAQKSIGVLKIIFKTFFRLILVLKKILDKTQIRCGYFGRLEKYTAEILSLLPEIRKMIKTSSKFMQSEGFLTR